MNFFWGNIFEYFKDRRLASLFFGALGLFFLILLGVGIFYQFFLSEWPVILLIIGLWLLVLIGVGWRQMRARRLDRYKCSPLSRDEMAKARSKLRTKSTFRQL
jgi:uncharacterized membrane protein